MSNLDNGRKAIKAYMKNNDISEQTLATAYGVSRIWIQRILRGSETGRAANSLVLEIIRDFKIRENEEIK